MKTAGTRSLLLTIALWVVASSQTTNAMNSSKSLPLENDVKNKKESINRLKYYYPPSDSEKKVPLNPEEVKYAIKLLREGQKKNLDLIDKIQFFYDPSEDCAAAGGKEIPEIFIGKNFYQASKKSQAMTLKHELAHFVHGDTRTNKLELCLQAFATITTMTAGIFALVHNDETWLSMALKMPACLGMMLLAFFGTEVVCNRKHEYDADTYAALNCPNSTYIRAEINYYSAESIPFWNTLSSKTIKNIYRLPRFLRLTAYGLFRLSDMLSNNSLLSILEDPEHPTAANRIKNFEKIMKKIELKENIAQQCRLSKVYSFHPSI